ncbi:MAG: glycosyltransferase family 4 protein [Desulfobacteraceae bacterium]|nr:glycosyltransferase family 4 protein [Desulfobacteraceae bacterium]MBC2720060.1 glycosyltransferase family 4 protein [Desulfobacteraceae bacterium]
MKNKIAKNILLVTSANFPFGGAGANVLRLLTTGLVKNNRNVDVLIQRGKRFGKKSNLGMKNGRIGGVFYAYCGYLARPENYIKKIADSCAGMFVPPLIVLRKKLGGKIDCVLVYNGTAYECIPLIIICKILRIPIINHVVEWYEKETVANSWWKLPAWWDFLFRMKVLNRYFAGLMVTSNFLKKYYTKRHMSDERIFVLPNLVNFSIFDSRGIHGSKNRSIRIGYCGTPTRKDGINDLLSAFQIVLKKNPDSELFVIGDTTGNKSVLPKLKEISKLLEIFDKVTFTGLVEWEQMPSLLNSCDILILARPSGRFAEAGFPTKLGEYMACKKPVVVTKVGDIPLYLRDKESAMLVEPNNPESIASGICYLIDYPEKAKKIGDKGYIWARNKLDYTKATQDIGQFLDTFKYVL